MGSWINDNSPYNNNLAFWLLADAGLVGNATWTDLSESVPAGTLTNMDPSTDWIADKPLGGFGALSFDGIDDRVVFSNLSRSPEMTWSFRVRPRSKVANNSFFSGDQRDQFFLTTTGLRLEWINIKHAINAYSWSFGYGVGDWLDLDVSLTLTTISLYLGGVLVGTQPLVNQNYSPTAGQTYVGSFRATNFFDGEIAEIRVVSGEAWDSGKIAGYHAERTSGYPTTLLYRGATGTRQLLYSPHLVGSL